jgi:hypothetical protein
MGIEKRKGSNVVLCDKCGGVISWEVDSNLKHGFTCTKCIDKDYGKYRVLDLYKYEIERLGIDPDNLTDDKMAVIADKLSAELLMGGYWTSLQKILIEEDLA